MTALTMGIEQKQQQYRSEAEKDKPLVGNGAKPSQ